jgi:hypothetical protein
MVELEELSLLGRHFAFERMGQVGREFSQLVILERRWLRRSSRREAQDAVFVLFVVEGHGRMLLAAKSRSECSPGQAENPGGEGGFASKGIEGGKDIDEDFLGRLFGVGTVA